MILVLLLYLRPKYPSGQPSDKDHPELGRTRKHLVTIISNGVALAYMLCTPIFVRKILLLHSVHRSDDTNIFAKICFDLDQFDRELQMRTDLTVYFEGYFKLTCHGNFGPLKILVLDQFFH